MIIAPQRAFLVDYKINNPSDTSTHYVRAYIKNSITGVTLATLNLTDNGSGYFSKEWVTPADTTGTGLQISILTTVYDDANYTSESLVYGTTLERFIVRDLASSRNSFGMGGTQSGLVHREVDYKLIQKMVVDAISGIKMPVIPKLPKIPEQKEIDLSGLDEIRNDISSLKSYIDTKLSEILTIKEEIDKQIKGIGQEISIVKELPAKFEQAEVSDDELHSFITSKMIEINTKGEELKNFVSDNIEQLTKNIEEKLSEPVKLELSAPQVAERSSKVEEKPNPRMNVLKNLFNIV